MTQSSTPEAQQPVFTAFSRGEKRKRMVRCYLADADSMSRHLLSDALMRDEAAMIVGATGDERVMLREIETLQPDAVFIDARMLSDMTRARLASDVVRECCIIFVSSVASDATSAFACEATDFLLKPASRLRVLTTLERVRQRLDERALVDWARELSEGTSLTLSAGRAPAEKASATEGVLVVKSRGGTEYLPLSCIEVIESSGDIVRIATTECVVETSTPLFELERRLDPALFIRTHRAIIVNVRTARRLDTASRGCGLLLLHSGRTVSVSRRRIAAVRQALRHQVSSAP